MCDHFGASHSAMKCDTDGKQVKPNQKLEQEQEPKEDNRTDAYLHVTVLRKCFTPTFNFLEKSLLSIQLLDS